MRVGKGKSRASEQAKGSGFASKLREWVALNRARRLEGPRSIADVARDLTDNGLPSTANRVHGWEREESLPDAEAVAALEMLMGVPWAWLHDPKTSWPPDPAITATFDATLRLCALPRNEAERDVAAGVLKAGLDRARRTGPLR